MGRREDNKAMKRDRLLSEGLRLFAEQGYEGSSIEQIAAASGVARGTFYLYFPDKRALFEALVDRWFLALQAIFAGVQEGLEASDGPEQAWEVYRGMAADLVLLGLTHAPEIRLSFQESRTRAASGVLLRERERGIVSVAVAFTELAMARGWVREGDPRVLCLVIFGAVERLVYEVLTGSELGDPARIAAEMVAVFQAALAPQD